MNRLASRLVLAAAIGPSAGLAAWSAEPPGPAQRSDDSHGASDSRRERSLQDELFRLFDPQATEREAAIESIRRRGVEAVGAARPLLERLAVRDESDAVSRAAATALREHGLPLPSRDMPGRVYWDPVVESAPVREPPPAMPDPHPVAPSTLPLRAQILAFHTKRIETGTAEQRVESLSILHVRGGRIDWRSALEHLALHPDARVRAAIHERVVGTGSAGGAGGAILFAVQHGRSTAHAADLLDGTESDDEVFAALRGFLFAHGRRKERIAFEQIRRRTDEDDPLDTVDRLRRIGMREVQVVRDDPPSPDGPFIEYVDPRIVVAAARAELRVGASGTERQVRLLGAWRDADEPTRAKIEAALVQGRSKVEVARRALRRRFASDEIAPPAVRRLFDGAATEAEAVQAVMTAIDSAEDSADRGECLALLRIFGPAARPALRMLALRSVETTSEDEGVDTFATWTRLLPPDPVERDRHHALLARLYVRRAVVELRGLVEDEKRLRGDVEAVRRKDLLRRLSFQDE